MREPLHPLNRPLPPDVAAGESAFIQFYQKYAVFSWPWAWRRTAIFGAIGVLGGTIFGASHGLMVKDVSEAISVGLAVVAGNLVLIGVGPLLAAVGRHAGWPRRAEHAFIVAAVICGVVLGAIADDLSSQFHDRAMLAH